MNSLLVMLRLVAAEEPWFCQFLSWQKLAMRNGLSGAGGFGKFIVESRNVLIDMLNIVFLANVGIHLSQVPAIM